MKVLHAYNQHRGGGGADNAARATIEISRQYGLDVEVYTRSSADLPDGLRGRLEAGLSAIYAGGSVKRFDAMLCDFKPDVVHIHEVFPLVSPWILPCCTKRGVPVVKTCVDYRLTCPLVTHLYKGEICRRCTGGREHSAVLRNCRQNLTESVIVALYNKLTRWFRLFDRHVSRFIAPSDFTGAWISEHARIDPSRITTISPAVEIPASAADPGAGKYVAFAGRITHEKGIDTLLAAAGRCGLPVKLSRHESSLLNMEIPPEVDVVVTRDRQGLDAFYRGARMLVMPSIWFETFGLVAAEAMSHGIPAIVSRIGALTELVDDGVDGLLAEPRDPNDLADKIAELWADPDRCRRLGRAAREKAAARWSPRRHFERHVAVYEEVCSRS